MVVKKDNYQPTPNDNDTLVDCLNCGGEYEKFHCRWCFMGAMTATMKADWLQKKSGVRRITD